MEEKIILNVYGIIVELTGDGGGSITSLLHEDEDPEDMEIRYYNSAMDGIESIILSHAIAGIDITTPEYKEGIESAVQGCASNI